MEDAENTHYVSFLDDSMRTEAEGAPRGQEVCPQQGGPGQRPAVEYNLRHGNSSMFRKLLQSHRYKTRLAAAIGFLSVILFAGSFLYLHSLNNSENDIFPGGWSPDVRRRSASTGGSGSDSPVWNIAGDPFEAWNWSDEQFEGVFSLWAKDFNKSYASAEERAQRFRVFRRNVIYIATHNSQGFSYKLRVNGFADLTPDEFRVRYLGYRRPVRKLQGEEGGSNVANDLLSVNEKDLPASIDWRSKGCVREVKDQGSCGSCWAFSATGALEGAACAQTGRNVDLSEQQLVDCSGYEGNQGCGGGEMDAAFKYVIDNNGLCTEKDYPYTAHVDKCKKTCKAAVHVKEYKDVPRKHPEALMGAIAKFGPVAVGIEADQLPFQFYHEGVFDASCGNILNHGVLVVGYGTDSVSGKDFWLVKNSWGNSWGDHGYIKLARHVGSAGECGILLEPSFPVVTKEEASESSTVSEVAS